MIGDSDLVSNQHVDLAGNLLSTFTNPAPESVLGFGVTVAAAGESVVIVGADGSGSESTAGGAVYLFNTNGALISTLVEPRPGNHQFGRSVAAVSGDKVIVGAPWDDTGANHAESRPVFLMLLSQAGISIVMPLALLGLMWLAGGIPGMSPGGDAVPPGGSGRGAGPGVLGYGFVHGKPPLIAGGVLMLAAQPWCAAAAELHSSLICFLFHCFNLHGAEGAHIPGLQ